MPHAVLKSCISRHRLTVAGIRARSRIHRTLLAEPAAVAFTRIRGFQLCLLSRRDEVSMFLEILDDLLANNFSLETAQCAFDRFISVYGN